MNNMPMELYTDGSCLNNPGPGGIGYVIRYWKEIEGKELPEVQQIEKSLGFKLTTNNRMEIWAGVSGLLEIVIGIKTGLYTNVSAVNLKTDSKYFCDAINRRWIDKWQQNNWVTSAETPVKNRDLWEQLTDAISQLRSAGAILNIEHVMGHAGHEFNELADKLATSASKDSTNHIIDEVYEKQNKR